MANPPPNAPFMKQIRNTPAKATRTVAAVSSDATDEAISDGLTGLEAVMRP